MVEVISVFRVEDLKNKKNYEYEVSGSGQEAISLLRKSFGFFAKFVLLGFKINGNFTEIEA